jgi:predicted PolB exonuclease-like 3'-5' exonuclease
MLDSKPIEKIVFFDIETSSQSPTFKELPIRMQGLFKKRFKKEFDDIDLNAPADTVETMQEYVYSTKAPLFAEFGRILCISMGLLSKVGEEYQMKIVTYADDNEKTLLEKFLKGTEKITGSVMPEYHWCAHNANIFDVPFITKRIILNRLVIPKMFDCAHLKPWEKGFIIDTKEVWKFGVFDNNASLDLLCAIMEVPSSKDDIDGSQVKDMYWVEKDLKRICMYCEKDCVALATVYLRMKGLYNEVKQVITNK